MSVFDEIRGEANGHVSSIHSALSEQNERLGEACHYLSRLVESTLQEVDSAIYTQKANQATVAAGATDCVVQMPIVPPGHGWEWLLVTTTGVAGGPCAVYFDTITPQTLAYFIPDAGIFSDTGLRIYVRERSSLLFHFYGQPVGQICTALIQAREFAEYPRSRADSSANG